LENYKNLAEFFKTVTDFYPDKNAIQWRNPLLKENFKYEGLTGSKLKELVYLAAKAIGELGLKKGDKAAIISETRFEWVVTDFACVLNGIITVPIYATMTSQQVKFILEHSEAKLCFVSTKLLAEKVAAVFKDLPGLKHIISFNKTENEPEYIINFEDLIYKEVIHDKNAYNEADANAHIEEASKKLNENDILTIIYTSGTTGNPKGVCLSHKNVLANIKQCTDSFEITDKDRFLSFLPLAHTYERTAGYYLPLSKGAEIYYAQSIETLNAQMMEVKPTVLLTVPILFTRIQSRIMKNIEQLPGFKKTVAKKALQVAVKHRENKKSFLWKLADKKVLSEIRSRTGGKIRFFISGGSALNKELAEFFDGLGILILQGYGMTEASPVISVNRPESNVFGTVGQPLIGVEVKIAADGEILVKGDNVMLGYFNNPKDTDETIIDGWLHTGDIG
jgi:long-chain acyl-CoA synthetase